ncbi:hypothetical protein [Anaerosporobacter sp.]
MKKNKLIAVFLTVVTLSSLNSNSIFNSMPTVSASEQDSIKTINEMVESVGQKDWSTFIDLMCSEEREYFQYYFSSENRTTNGIKQVESMSLESITPVNETIANDELLVNEYAILSYSDNIETYLVGLYCNVSEENQYFYNGLNYFNITLANDDGKMKIVQFNKPSYYMATETLDIEVTDPNYTDKCDAINSIEASDRGYLINAEGEDITNDSFNVTTDESNQQSAIYSTTNNYSSHPALKTYTNYSAPDTMTVLMNKVDEDHPAAVEYSFDFYIKNTLPNECILSTFGTAALKANAYCVKGVGLYHSIKPVNSAGGYEVTQYTQNFQVGTSNTISDKIFDSIADKYVVNSSSKVFFPEFGTGTEGKTGSSKTGRLLHYGSKLLDEQGKTYLQILNYYYSGSDCSSGDVKIVTIN